MRPKAVKERGGATECERKLLQTLTEAVRDSTVPEAGISAKSIERLFEAVELQYIALEMSATQ